MHAERTGNLLYIRQRELKLFFFFRVSGIVLLTSLRPKADIGNMLRSRPKQAFKVGQSVEPWIFCRVFRNFRSGDAKLI